MIENVNMLKQCGNNYINITTSYGKPQNNAQVYTVSGIQKDMLNYIVVCSTVANEIHVIKIIFIDNFYDEPSI